MANTSRAKIRFTLTGLAALVVLLLPGLAQAAEHAEEAEHNTSMPTYLVLPFAGLLLCIAILPLVIPHWWEHNRNRAIISALFGIPMAAYLLMTHSEHALLHSMLEYADFIILLGSLFVISGGIFLRGDIRATPRNNLLFLILGSVLASIIGTTGAAMLLIRPMLRTNSERKNTTHIPIFFIFAVANMGGLLTPLGDPPLFLGFLRGVPFTWTFGLILPWLMGLGIVLTIFYIIDLRAYKKETPEAIKFDDSNVQPIRLDGSLNFLFLVGVILAVLALPGAVATDGSLAIPWRELAMVLMAVLSYYLGPKKPRNANEFNFEAINEVAILFVAIFITMVPALHILQVRGPEMPLHAAWHYFVATGLLSSFLDNAPTYLTFTSVASGALGTNAMHLKTLIDAAGQGGGPSGQLILEAISVGAVFMGANTYIGNGPNFMVKAISDGMGVKTPSFFGYMLWSGAILVPTYVLVAVVFFV